MTKECKSLGIAIDIKQKGERDRLLSLFTLDYGLLNCTLYGAMKSGKVSLYSEGTYSFSFKVEGGDDVSFLDNDIFSLHDGILENLESLGWSSIFSEMVIKGKDYSPYIYSLYTHSLDAEEEGERDKGAIYFIVNYLKRMGLLSSFLSCPKCGRKYSSDERIGFSPSLGSYVCSQCDEMDNILILPPNARLYLEEALRRKMEDFLSLNISSDMTHKISRNLLRSLKYSFRGELKSINSGLIK